MDLKLRAPGAHFRTAGPLGLSRSGGPLTLRSNVDSLSEILTPGPIGHNAWNERAAHVAFSRALLAKQIESRQARGSKQILGLPKSELRSVPDGQEMHKDVAPLFNKMWQEIEAAFKARKNATTGDLIQVASAYRSASRDNDAWWRYFPGYLKKTESKRRKTGEAFGLGPRSLNIMFEFMNGKKAPAGYSGHTHGIAADLTTREKGHTWGIDSAPTNQAGWQKTWLYQWLVANAGKHKFYQLKTETWHWEYHEGKIPSQCWGASVKERPIPKG